MRSIIRIKFVRVLKLLVLIMFNCLIGCIPKQQATITGGKDGEHLGIYEEPYGSILQMGTIAEPKKITIIGSKSYVVDPKGIRREVEIEPHEFDIETKSPNIRDRVFVLDTSKNRMKRLYNGIWKFYITFKSQSGQEETREFVGKYWTFYYNPILHGPPN